MGWGMKTWPCNHCKQVVLLQMSGGHTEKHCTRMCQPGSFIWIVASRKLYSRKHKQSAPYFPITVMDKWHTMKCTFYEMKMKIPMNIHRIPWLAQWQKTICQCRRSKFDPWVGKIPWRR